MIHTQVFFCALSWSLWLYELFRADSCDWFTCIDHDYFTGTAAIVQLPQCASEVTLMDMSKRYVLPDVTHFITAHDNSYWENVKRNIGSGYTALSRKPAACHMESSHRMTSSYHVTSYFTYTPPLFSTDPFSFRWSRWCIRSVSYNHHHIEDIKLSYCWHIFSLMCVKSRLICILRGVCLR